MELCRPGGHFHRRHRCALYANSIAKDYEYVINHAECRLVLSAGGDIYQKLKSILPNCSSVEKVYTFDPEEGVEQFDQS
jgi:hypothetical protein